MKTLIHKQAREELRVVLPGLDSHSCNCPREDHWNLLSLFLFNPWIDKETGAIRVGAESVARALGKSIQFNQGNFNAGKYLAHFMNFIIPGIASLVKDDQGRDYSVSTWEMTELGMRKIEDGLQRRCFVNWPENVKQIVYNETHGIYTDEKVYISNGNKRRSSVEIQNRKAREIECNNVIEIAATPMAKYIARYHHALPMNGFTKILNNADAAQLEIDRIENPHARLQQTMILDAIKESPKPFYKPTERSDRLFGYGANITNLSRSVRKVLTAGWTEMDLKQAQLAIVGKLWNIPEVNDFLQSGKSFWKELSNDISIELTNDSKDKLKRASYACIFGMSQRNLLEQLTKDFSKEIAENFLSHYIIKALLKARSAYMDKLLKQGFMVDPFAKVHVVTKNNVLSIIAREAQAYEQVLLYPVYELTNTTDDFSIQLVQHDGFSVAFHNVNTKDLWIKRICEVVDETAKRLGIHTRLEHCENLLPEAPKEVQEEIVSTTIVENIEPVAPESIVMPVEATPLAAIKSLSTDELERIYIAISGNRSAYEMIFIERVTSERIFRSLFN